MGEKSQVLTPEDAENVCDIFHREIIHHRFIQLTLPKISKTTIKWHQEHAKYIEELKMKVIRLMNVELKGKPKA